MTRVEEQLPLPEVMDPVCEVSDITSEATDHQGHFWNTLGKLALGTVIVACGAGLGGYHGALVAANSPTHIELIPGISTDVVLQNGTRGSVLSTGLGNVSLPALHEHVPYVGEIGIMAKLNTVQFSGNTVSAAAAVLNNPGQIIEKPVRDALVRHIKAGTEKGALEGSAGGIVVAAGGRLAFSEYQRRRHEHERSQQSHQAHVRSMRWGAATLGLAVVTFACAESNLASHHTTRPDEAMTAIDPSLTAGISLLKGAMVTTNSPFEYIINNAVVGILQTKTDIDNYYQKLVVPNIDTALATWSADPANQVWLRNQSLVPTIFVAGEHCSVPYASWVAPDINKFLKPLVIVKTGDIMVNADISLFGQYCENIGKYGIVAAVKATNQQVKVIVASGDHDPDGSIGPDLRAQLIPGPDNKLYKPYGVLDESSNYTATAYGITVVGAPNPVQNIYGMATEVNGKPASNDDINKALAKTSDLITNAACKVSAAGKIKPIIAAHVRELEYAAMDSACAGDVFNGEGPGDLLYSYSTPDNNRAVFAIEPSASGIGNGDSFSPYEKIISDAKTIFALIDKQTNTIVGIATLTIHPDGSVNITPIELPPNNLYNPHVISSYLEQFNPSALPTAPFAHVRGGLRPQ